jgi:anti-anti-sigma factor
MIDFTAAEHPEDPTVRVIAISGKLDNESSEYFFNCIEDQIKDGHTRLILDCSQLEYVSSMGLGSLMRTHSRMKKHMGDVKIAAMQDFVAEAFRIVGFEKILHLYESVDDAKGAFSASV